MGRDRLGSGERAGVGWPAWARRLATGGLLFHLTAIVAAALSAPPSSPLERALADRFARYYDLIDQGHAYRFYAPEPPPTPVVTARLRFDDGRVEQEIRLPDRSLRPRLRYQRHLALANHLYVDFEAARRAGAEGGGPDRPPSLWGASYARHLCRTRGCDGVALYVRMHLIPDLDLVLDELAGPGAGPVDLDAERFYTTPERIGDYSCDAF